MENLCITNRCAACCIDVAFRMSHFEISQPQISWMAKEARKNNTSHQLLIESGEVIGIQIQGRCPYLNEKNLCSIYDEPIIWGKVKRPSGCSFVQPKNETCNMARSRQGLIPLSSL